MGFTIFVSHAHEDAALVESLQSIIDETLDDVAVRSSSSRPVRGGIEPGTLWLEWIHKSVSSSDATIIVLTSESYNRPWLLWEAGAVSGVSIAVSEKPIIPMVFELPPESIPGPLRHHQLVDGYSEEGITDLLNVIYDRVQRPSATKFQQLLRLQIPHYLRSVRDHIDDRRIQEKPAPDARKPLAYDRTYQGEDLDLTIVNFSPKGDPEDTSGVTIVNNDGDWLIEIDVESPLRGVRHVADMRFRRDFPAARGRVAFRVDSGEVERHEEVIDLANVRYHKYIVEYLSFRTASRIAKISIRPMDDDARQAGAFCLDSVSVFSVPRAVVRSS